MADLAGDGQELEGILPAAWRTGGAEDWLDKMETT